MNIQREPIINAAVNETAHVFNHDFSENSTSRKLPPKIATRPVMIGE